MQKIINLGMSKWEEWDFLYSNCFALFDRYNMVGNSQCDQILQNFAILAKSSKSYLPSRNILDWLWQILFAIGQVFIDINGQMLKKF